MKDLYLNRLISLALTLELLSLLNGSESRAEPVCPIKLIPESVVVKYGSPISVSCRNTTSVEEIYWTTGPEVVNDTTWSVLELLDWDIRPGCKATFQGIGRCSKPLHITVYKTPDSVSISVLRHSGPMVEGTKYQLQCDIQNIAPLQNLVVRWYKGNETIETQTFNDSTKKPVNISSTLTLTHRSYEGEVEYRCEAELDLGPEEPKPTALSSKPLNVTVYSHTNKSTTPTAKSLTTADARWDEPFNYDYYFLRVVGLSMAAVLFILGIMVISCDKV